MIYNLNLSNTCARYFGLTPSLWGGLASLLPFLGALGFGAQFYYEVGDDAMMERLVCAGLWGLPPQPHLYFQSSHLGWLLHALYTMFPKITWYPLFLCSSLLLALFLCASTVSREQTKTKAVFFGLMLGLLWLPHLIGLQFTRVAIMVSLGTVVSLLANRYIGWIRQLYIANPHTADYIPDLSYHFF